MEREATVPPAEGNGWRVSPVFTVIRLRRNIEPLGEHLHIGGLVALAGRLGADMQHDAPVRADLDHRALIARHAGALDVISEADAAQPAVIALAPVREAVPVGGGEAGAHHRGEVAGIIGDAGVGGVRHLLRRDHVDGAQVSGAMPVSRAALSTRRSIR